MPQNGLYWITSKTLHTGAVCFYCRRTDMDTAMKTETKCRVAACAAGFALPRYAELPQVGLYLDQTVQYVNGCFRTFCGVELTPSMVSN